MLLDGTRTANAVMVYCDPPSLANGWTREIRLPLLLLTMAVVVVVMPAAAAAVMIIVMTMIMMSTMVVVMKLGLRRLGPIISACLAEKVLDLCGE